MSAKSTSQITVKWYRHGDILFTRLILWFWTNNYNLNILFTFSKMFHVWTKICTHKNTIPCRFTVSNHKPSNIHTEWQKRGPSNFVSLSFAIIVCLQSHVQMREYAEWGGWRNKPLVIPTPMNPTIRSWCLEQKHVTYSHTTRNSFN